MLINDFTDKQKKILFSFDSLTDDDIILFKFNAWALYLFPKYFKSPDAPFHEEMILANLAVYRGALSTFVNVAFRGAGKDVKTKLFIAFVILNDKDHLRRYFKVLAEDGDNSKQTVTDIYNMLISPKVQYFYPEVFEKTDSKREERMSSFTTSTGIKVKSDTVGVEQRGDIQEDARPDFIWFNDFETRKTLRSARETKNIAENMEEARTGLSKGGGCIYTCNYISEQGNVHNLIKKKSDSKKVMLLPIMDDKGIPTWDRYTIAEIEQMKNDDEDFEGERMCRPSASKDVYYDRTQLERMTAMQPLRDIAGFKIFKNYSPMHRYGSGHDVAGGVGLDSSTSVFIDFDTIPAQVVATYHSNTIQPEAFGDEIYNQGSRWGLCIQGVENNKFDQAVLKAKQLGANLYKTHGKDNRIGSKPAMNYGWNTNSLTKSKMLSSVKIAIEDGLLQLNDGELIEEARSFTRNDLIDAEPDARLTTRHFDLVMALAIAWQMKDFSTPSRIPRDPEAGMWGNDQKKRKNPAL